MATLPTTIFNTIKDNSIGDAIDATWIGTSFEPIQGSKRFVLATSGSELPDGAIAFERDKTINLETRAIATLTETQQMHSGKATFSELETLKGLKLYHELFALGSDSGYTAEKITESKTQEIIGQYIRFNGELIHPIIITEGEENTVIASARILISECDGIKFAYLSDEMVSPKTREENPAEYKNLLSIMFNEAKRIVNAISGPDTFAFMRVADGSQETYEAAMGGWNDAKTVHVIHGGKTHEDKALLTSIMEAGAQQMREKFPTPAAATASVLDTTHKSATPPTTLAP